jgi:sec-independent protein translocase protein TatA
MSLIGPAARMPGGTRVGFIGEIGTGELLVVLAAALLLFGSRRLPEIARSIGRAVEELRRASQKFRDQLMNADGAAAPEAEPGDHPGRPPGAKAPSRAGTPPADTPPHHDRAG